MATMMRSMCFACVMVAALALNRDTCKARDGDQWLKPSECMYGCCVQSSDRGRICGSSDDCSNEGGEWVLMALISVACALLLVGACFLVLVCFDVPIPCCNQQVQSLMQRWVNRKTLNARTPTPSQPAQPQQSAWTKLDDCEPVPTDQEQEVALL
eukprot:TRINITY_DN3321_c0_g1_i2.p2 TRINITY_DN3321_c0_g1~~TRINITY_DN3321_c0_g1_i2.p2  ORF type:complete len:155 (-),score=18.07 TRINITY_DN3321_c0_g1_i2:484-948(-)